MGERLVLVGDPAVIQKEPDTSSTSIGFAGEHGFCESMWDTVLGLNPGHGQCDLEQLLLSASVFFLLVGLETMTLRGS